MGVNVLGVMAGTRDAARHMAEHGGGSIINITSIGGIQAGGGVMIYRASKAAVIQFTKSAAIELAYHEIRVNAIAPGSIPTPILGKSAAGMDPEQLQQFEARIRQGCAMTAHSSATARPMTSPRPRCISPPTGRATSPGPCCRWTADGGGQGRSTQEKRCFEWVARGPGPERDGASTFGASVTVRPRSSLPEARHETADGLNQALDLTASDGVD